MVKKKIAIVTWDLYGPVKNGGIGTACLGLAQSLQSAGHQVTICFLPNESSQIERIGHWVDWYGQQRIQLLVIPEYEIKLDGLPFSKASYSVYQFLKNKNEEFCWDVVHFPDMQGLGYYSLKAKKTLGFFENTILTTIGHGQSAWHSEFNHESQARLSNLELDYLEAECLKESDFVFAPTQFALNEILRNEKINPNKCLAVPNILPEFGVKKYSGKKSNFDQIVFFGRLETRKGLEVFVEALLKIKSDFYKNKKVIFLGKFGNISGHNANDYIAEKLKDSGIHYQLIPHFSSKAALEYLISRNPLVVVPSLSETMGYALCECIELDLPVIASRIPAFENILSEECQSDILFSLGADELAQKILNVDSGGVASAKRSMPNDLAKREWLLWHQNLPENSRVHDNANIQPLVSVCIPHRNRAKFLEEALASLCEQTYSNIEILIGDDASDDEQALGYLRGLQKKSPRFLTEVYFYDKQSGPGVVRNNLAREAKGEFLFFMDDDNVALPNEIETFVKAQARTQADMLTCPFDSFSSEGTVRRWLPVGPAHELGYFFNVYGDMNSLIRKKTFFDVGGVNSTFNFGGEDWEFFMRATKNGASLEVLPEPLVKYRLHDGHYSNRTDTELSRELFIDSYFKNSSKEDLKFFIKTLEGFQLKLCPRYIASSAEIAEMNRLSRDAEIADGQAVVYRLDPLSIQHDSFDHEHSRYEILDDELFLDVFGDDPSVILPEFKIPEGHRLFAKVELWASTDSHFTIYMQTKSHLDYSDATCSEQEYSAGASALTLELNPEVTGPIRLDPAAHAGTFVLRSFSIYSEVDNGLPISH